MMNSLHHFDPLSLQRSVGHSIQSIFVAIALLFLFGSVREEADVYAQAAHPLEETVVFDAASPLLRSAEWASIESDSTLSVAWGHVDGDGEGARGARLAGYG